MPATDIQPRESSAIASAYVVRSRPSPPYSSGDAHAEEAHLAQALDDLLGVLVARLEVVRDRDDLAVDEVAHGVQDVELLVAEIEPVEAADALAHVPLPLL